MRFVTALLAAFAVLPATYAQSINVNFSVDATKDTLRISPYIYGVNAGTTEAGVGITARRLGGNRMTGYNWENNASSAGSDWNQSSDNYLTWVFGIPTAFENVPGITLTAFHDTSLAHNCYTLLTLPAAGYVARDKNGTVTASQVAPSPRWREVRNFKGSAFSLSPDTSDGYVNVDEEVNFLVNRYGPASGTTGVKGYDIDNEPALWRSTHPRIHPDTVLCKELIAKVSAAGRAVKSVDPSAEVFGGVFYGFNEYYNFQNAPDWKSYKSYENFAAALLANLRDSSLVAGRRLMDVLDMHWYPDLNVPVGNENTDSTTVYNRVEAPRTLWDSSYVENGWIGTWFHPQSAAILRKTQRIISQQNPGTKLSVSEYYYGGATHISGAVAMADVLGIFGDTGVYFASLWGDATGYIASAYRMYRNYDGGGGRFGNLKVGSSCSNNEKCAVHAALQADDNGTLHIVAINRSFHQTVNAGFTITSGTPFLSAAVFGLHGGDTGIVPEQGVPIIAGNQFSYSLAPMSVYHFVLTPGATAVAGEASPLGFSLEQNYPNPFNPKTGIRVQLSGDREMRLVVYDLLGREVAVLANGRYVAGEHTFTFNGSNVSSGVYFYRLMAGDYTAVRKMILTK